MADKVGIIDNGILLEELTMEELRYKNRHFVKLTVSDISRAIPIMEKELAINDYETLNDNEVKVFQLDIDLEKINRVLVTSGIGVSELSVKKGSLEEYFLKLTGGASIG